MAKWVDLDFSSGDTVSGSDFNSLQDKFAAIAEQATDAPFMPSYAMEVAHGVESYSQSLGVNPLPVGSYFPNGFQAVGHYRNTSGILGIDSNMRFRFKDAVGAWHNVVECAPFGQLNICSSNYLYYIVVGTDTAAHMDYLSANSESQTYNTATFIDEDRLTVGQYNNLLDNLDAFAHGAVDAPKLSTSGDSMRCEVAVFSEFQVDADTPTFIMPAGLLCVTINGADADCGFFTHIPLSVSDIELTCGRYAGGNIANPNLQGELIMSTGSNYIFNAPIGGGASTVYYQMLSTTVASLGSQAYPDFTSKEYGHSVVASDINTLNDFVTPVLEGVKASSGSRPDMRWNCVDHLSYTEGVTTLASGTSVVLQGLQQIMKIDTDHNDLDLVVWTGAFFASVGNNFANTDKWIKHTWGHWDASSATVKIDNSGASPRGFHWRKF